MEEGEQEHAKAKEKAANIGCGSGGIGCLRETGYGTRLAEFGEPIMG
jgi:hypothetical protein